MDLHTLFPILLVCYVAWRMYVRVRRQIGRQPLKSGRLVYLIVIYSVITLVVGFVAAMRNPEAVAGLGVGLVLGAAAAIVGLRLTKFETTAEGQFYTPNTFIGIGLSALFIGRLVYRFFILYNHPPPNRGPGPSATIAQSPLTLLIFGLLFGYYLAYFTGVLMRGKREKRALIETPSSAP
jgi:hypothetical protein